MTTKNTLIVRFATVVSWLISFLPYYWIELFGYEKSMSLAREVLPVLLWVICFYLVNRYRTDALYKYWWMLISAPVCAAPLVLKLITIASWRIGGFAP